MGVQEQRCGLLKSAILRGRARWLRQEGIRDGLWSDRLKMGCDCSGLDAPFIAAGCLSLPVQQVFSSVINPKAQAWLKSLGHTETLFHDIVSRSTKDLPDVDGYIAGFPCQPFSHQSHLAKGFGDVRTKVLDACLQSAAAMLPLFIVFENVMGLKRYMSEFLERLGKHKLLSKYQVCILPLCPRIMCREPTARPRLYMLLVRRDRLLPQNSAQVNDFLQTLISEVMTTMPDAAVDDFLGDDGATRAATQARGTRPDAKWIKEHRAMRKKVRMSPPSLESFGSFSARSRSTVEYVAHTCSVPLVVDVSQSLHRIPTGKNHGVPCMTTSSDLVYVESPNKYRRLSANEVLALQGFPMDKLRPPTSLTARDLCFMAGNTMHIRAISMGILLALSLIRWSSSAPGEAETDTADKEPVILEWSKGRLERVCWTCLLRKSKSKTVTANSKKGAKPPKKKAAVKVTASCVAKKPSCLKRRLSEVFGRQSQQRTKAQQPQKQAKGSTVTNKKTVTPRRRLSEIFGA